MPLLIPTAIVFAVSLWFVISNESTIALVGLLASIGLFYGIYYFWTNTYYEIKKERLYYRSISVKGNIPIQKIKRIEKGEYPKGGSPALAFTGINIFHSTGNKLFIAPEDADSLIRELKAVNRRIKVEVE